MKPIKRVRSCAATPLATAIAIESDESHRMRDDDVCDEGGLAAARPPSSQTSSSRILWLSSLSIAIAVASGVAAQLLTRLIGFITNVAFYGRVSSAFVSPADNHLGWWVVL